MCFMTLAATANLKLIYNQITTLFIFQECLLKTCVYWYILHKTGFIVSVRYCFQNHLKANFFHPVCLRRVCLPKRENVHGWLQRCICGCKHVNVWLVEPLHESERTLDKQELIRRQTIFSLVCSEVSSFNHTSTKLELSNVNYESGSSVLSEKWNFR